MQLYNSEYNWYKGNLHTHTTRSDGALTPEAAMALYRSHGYDFLSLTDHDKYGPGGMRDGLLLLPGIELAYNDNEGRRAYHVVGIGADAGIGEYPDKAFGNNPQNIIDHIRRHDGYAILAHPSWSLLSHEDALALEGYEAVEVMNTVSDPGTRGDSSNFCDVLMSRGRPLPLIASDDAHFYNGDECKSFVMVNSPALDQASILGAMRAGRFFASQGPLIRSIFVEDRKITVNTSPVRIIRFMSDTFYNKNRRHVCDMDANQAVYEIAPTDRFVRIECEDAQGRRAWSGYIDVRS